MKNLLYILDILVLMLALFITGCATSEAGKNRTVSSGDTVVLDGSDGTFGDLNVLRFPEAEGSLHDNYVVYYPKDAITTDMPVVVFLEGGGEEPKIDDYR
ncbi:MAG: hypothetical protein HF962_08845, partial [Sulfurovum sp.]|nr:hypothetical protein [Sulfurovum sp.]